MREMVNGGGARKEEARVSQRAGSCEGRDGEEEEEESGAIFSRAVASFFFYQSSCPSPCSSSIMLSTTLRTASAKPCLAN